MLSGFLLGRGDLPRELEEDWEEDRSGTVPAARREGFLCVISDLSTLRRLEVTAPELIWSKSAVMSPAVEGLCGAAPGGGGGAEGALFSSNEGNGGGGGGGAPELEG